MTHEEVRALLPAYSAAELEDVGDLEVHLAACQDCSGELARYRELSQAVVALRDVTEEAPAGLRARVLAEIPPHRLRDDLRRLAEEHPRARVAAMSLGGAVVGAAAIGLIWWRAARRTLAEQGPGSMPGRMAEKVPV